MPLGSESSCTGRLFSGALITVQKDPSGLSGKCFGVKGMP